MTVVDTCFLIDLMGGDKGAVRTVQDFEAQGWTLYAPDVAVFELHRGLAQVRRPDMEWTKIKAVLKHAPRLPLDPEAIQVGGQLEGALKRHGTPIDTMDCMIAGIALRHGMAVVTRNVKDFERVTGLDVQTY